MTLGTTTQAYGDPSYWDNRYAQEPGTFDWYQKYPALAPLLHLYIPTHHRILVVGCGNSAFSEGMVDDGYVDVVNIDISSVAIEAMRKKCSNLPQLKYIKMDVRDMSAFQTGSFEAVVDKGTLDSLLCGSNSRLNATKMLEEVGRVLKDKGVYILITYGAPIYRLRLLRDALSCTIKLHVIEKLLSEESSGHKKWDLTSAIPLDDNGNSVEAALGKNPDVHYIYVCIKARPEAWSRGLKISSFSLVCLDSLCST
ncbi:Methyltransferase-like protein [Actinidia chinensis var. chinensis]|uniref:Methyltransferase-like protein n=1 Tax=Actinidia chinensis var. chinensis TaxID=1590841 RepID=A0A2R6PVN7_ACTCC|nr:Methyltransferase-like protein [Actinidia chinensis var. chinensis]